MTFASLVSVLLAVVSTPPPVASPVGFEVSASKNECFPGEPLEIYTIIPCSEPFLSIEYAIAMPYTFGFQIAQDEESLVPLSSGELGSRVTGPPLHLPGFHDPNGVLISELEHYGKSVQRLDLIAFRYPGKYRICATVKGESTLTSIEVTIVVRASTLADEGGEPVALEDWWPFGASVCSRRWLPGMPRRPLVCDMDDTATSECGQSAGRLRELAAFSNVLDEMNGMPPHISQRMAYIESVERFLNDYPDSPLIPSLLATRFWKARTKYKEDLRRSTELIDRYLKTTSSVLPAELLSAKVAMDADAALSADRIPPQ